MLHFAGLFAGTSQALIDLLHDIPGTLHTLTQIIRQVTNF
jgi:hypothetical protein